MECFTVKDLTFRYAGASRDSLHGLSFSVQQGEFVTVCGLSGSGKSTLLRQFKPMLRPHGESSGSILFRDRPLEELDLREQTSEIGFVLQSPDNQSITDKVWHELAFGLESLGIPPGEIQRRTAEIASFFGIEAWFERPVDTLSGGEKQLLNLAAVLILQPSVLILDEPVAQLDPIASEKFMAHLKKINRELGTTVILSSHDLESVFSAGSRILVLSEGRLLADTSPRDLSAVLYRTKNPVFLSLPTPSRLYLMMDQGSTPPLTVAEGREWLKSYSSRHPARELSLPPAITHAEKPCLRTDDIWFRYERNSEDILRGLSLSVYPGELLTVLGGNGTGKTTLLSVLAGSQKPYRGKVIPDSEKRKKSAPSPRIAMLPQDPQTLFVCRTVEEELWEMLEDSPLSPGEQEERILRVIGLCQLQTLLKQHPYDLSGGEQQRTALAKLLLTEPAILLLDEPTKNLDAAFKQRLAEILRRLTGQGTAVVSVSHDLEFAASFSDRCVMLFHGRIVSDDEPRRFFSANGIYTTAVCRLTHGLLRHTVTVPDVLEAFSVPDPTPSMTASPPKPPPMPPLSPPKKSSAPKGVLRFLCSVLLLGVFVLLLLHTAGVLQLPFLGEHVFLSYGLLTASALAFLVSVGKSSRNIPIVRSRPGRRSALITAAVVFVLVPATVAGGVWLLDDSKYLFISLLVLLESIVPFFILFEKRSVQAREIVMIAVLCALCVAGRGLFYMLPAFKPVTAIVILSAAALGSEAGFMIGSVSMLVSNILFGQGVWTPWQMLSMGLIGFFAGVLFRRRHMPVSRLTLSIFGFLSCFVIYGGIMNPATLILSRTPVTAASLLSVYGFGLPLDTVHALSTAVFVYLGAEPILYKLERVKQKYGLNVPEPSFNA